MITQWTGRLISYRSVSCKMKMIFIVHNTFFSKLETTNLLLVNYSFVNTGDILVTYMFIFILLEKPSSSAFLLFYLSWTVSPDGLLLQSSTVADTTSFKFADGVTEYVACSYIEFAERLLLPEYKNIPDEEVWIY